MNSADIRELFPGLRDTIYLNTANMAVGSAGARAAYETAVERWSAGHFDWMDALRAGEDARAIFAEIIGAATDEVALVPAVSMSAGIVAANLPPAKKGENILVGENEFTSNYFPWLLLRERGYDVRTVKAEGDDVLPEAFEARSDGGTRLIAVSAVASPTGFRKDIAAFSRIAARSGAWLFVDASQAAGAVPVDVVRDQIDFLAATSYKFLLGSRGMGYLYVRRGLLERMRPIIPGWQAGARPTDSFYGPAMELSQTASKLDAALTWFPAVAERASIGIFRRFGMQMLLDHNARLSRHLHDVLRAQCPAFHPFPEQHRSTIVSIPVPDPEATMARLRSANVVASVRAGRIRFSVHIYNREDEIDHAVEVLTRG